MSQHKLITGNQIQKYRNLWGLSQTQLAEAVQTSADYISDIEGGRKPLSLHSAWKFCTYFGISLDELYFGETPADLTDQIAESQPSYFSSSEISLLELLETCTEEECIICEQILKHALEVIRKNPDTNHSDKPKE